MAKEELKRHVLSQVDSSASWIRETGAHSEESMIDDPGTAYVLPAKLMALTVVDLLWGDAGLALKIKSEFRPAMTKEEYFAMWGPRAGRYPALSIRGGLPSAEL